MGERLGDSSYSVDVPEGWSREDHPECLTLHEEGSLQISSYRKESDDVTNDDLKDFAADDIPDGTQLAPFKFGDFSGFGVSSGQGDEFWWRWWLRSGHVMLFVTFNGPAPRRLEDLALVLNTLAHDDGAGA
jgi:hypothetical protein